MGSGRRRLFVALMLLMLQSAWTAAALGITCRAEVDQASARKGDVVILTVTAEGDFGWSADFTLPDVPGASLAGGGTNQSVSMVNGRTMASVSRTYYLTLTSSHDVTIGPVKIHAGQQNCTTDPVTIKVSAGAGNQAIPPSVSGNRVPRPTHSPQAQVPGSSRQGGVPGDDVFVTLEVDHDQAFVGQQIILSFNYFRLVQPWNNPTYTPPTTEGFWREDLGTERNFNRVINGRNYAVTQVRYALFPTRSGDLVIDPAQLQFPADVFGRFFNSRSRSSGPRVLRTDPVLVKVRELPAPRPADFSGLVASRLDLKAQVDRDSVRTGDPVSLKATLVADAFLKGFKGLTITPAEGVRLHDSTDSFQTDIRSGRLVGTIAVEKILVPQQGGSMSVPPIRLVWFDTVSQTYRTAEAKVAPVVVTGGDLAAEAGDASGFLRSGLTRLGEDLAFIHPVPRHLRRAKEPFTAGPWWWMLLVLPALLLGLLKFYLDKIAATGRDPRRLRRKQAWQRAKVLLDQADGSTEGLERCTAVAQAVLGYVADCAGLSVAEVEPEQVRALAASLADETTGEHLLEILSRCDAVRFSGQAEGPDQDLAAAARELLARLEQGRKAARPERSGAAALVLATACLVAGGLWPGSSRSVEPSAGADPARLMAEGNQAYTAGDLAAAQKLYLQVRDLGVDDPVLHFNLGNTYARQGMLGMAVASFLRARRLDPRDQDIRQNLGWVRDNLRDLKLTQSSLPLFIAQISAAIDYLTLDEWGLIFLALVWMLCLLAGWGLVRAPVGDTQRRALVALAGVLVLVAAATFWRWYQDVGRRQGVVIVDTVAVRSGPTESFPVLFEVHDGLTVHLAGMREGWVRISLGGDWTGWLPAADVEAVDLGTADGQGR